MFHGSHSAFDLELQVESKNADDSSSQEVRAGQALVQVTVEGDHGLCYMYRYYAS